MMRCKIDECPREVKFKRKELCGVHYHRIRAHGNPYTVKRTPTGTPLPERVLPEEKWKDVDTGYETPCREWQGNTNPDGYGTIKFNNKQLKLHRVMYEMFVGEIPKGNVIMHRCDNPPCANPDHLQAGTQAENVRDAARKGRTNAPKNLNDDQVHELRERWRKGERQSALEKEFSIPGGTISRIISGAIYGKVPDLSKDIEVDWESRLSTLPPDRLQELRGCVDRKLTMTEIAKEIGVYSETVKKYFPGYGSWDWKSDNIKGSGIKERCKVCGKVRTTQNMARHQKNAICIADGIKRREEQNED